MSEQSDQQVNVNSWFEEEMAQQFRFDPSAVDESWRPYLKSNGQAARSSNGQTTVTPAANGAAISAPAPANGTAVAPAPATAPAITNGAAPAPAANGDELQPLRGIASKIAENMDASISVPTATSQRIVNVKVIEENRAIINQHRTLQSKSKVSYTHLIAYAILKALKAYPGVNNSYTVQNGQPTRVVRQQVNFGLAVDVAGKDGSRSLLVPNIKNAGAMDFAGFLKGFDDVVARARAGKLMPQDFQGTSISLTNPGTVGTFGSVPRLVPGQGAIIATGAIDYPAEYQGVSPEVRNQIGVSKVMAVSCTYDHRIIQGAESGAFLGVLHSLLLGEQGFYQEVFSALGVPYPPVQMGADQPVASPAGLASQQVDPLKAIAVSQLVHVYRVRGHLLAELDPLGSQPTFNKELDPATYGLTVWDLDREFPVGTLQLRDKQGRPRRTATLREILDTLRQTYCGRLGCEYMHIQHFDQREWLQAHMEPSMNQQPLESATKTRILERLLEAEEFEHFLQNRFVGQKRFSLEGAETAIPMLDELLNRAAEMGAHEAVIGMAHRGRLNILKNIVGKSATQIFSEFEGIDPDSVQGSGDVKYHLGATGVRRTAGNQEIGVSVAFNPSHLEAVDPVVEGIVRPKQDRLGDTKRERVIPVLLHGDAAFAGQGVVMETLNMSQLNGYATGGTVHLVINNQIGFTTTPDEARSTMYCTDIARTVQAPIFHVNGDHPEFALRAMQLAFDFRQQFKKDVVIDMVCYRRHGHNEGDDPSYTQPVMYRKIKEHPSSATQYGKRLVREKLMSDADVEALRQRIRQQLADAHDAARKGLSEPFEVKELTSVSDQEASGNTPETAVSRDVVTRVVEGLGRFPDSFRIHPKLKNFVDKRREALSGMPIDWALGESLAFGSMVLEGTPVRLSGQDSGRGTFSQRHLEFFDTESGVPHTPLKHLSPEQARFEVYDSSLSEYAVMGFEFGYTVADPLSLVMWEGQFGDFVNGAQIMIDQFLSSCESKWGQPSGLVLLLPHGYEGQGPEHSSARIERFLQLCAEDNIQVCNCTTPAQYFHLLRRQMYGGPDRRGIRKPLVIATPKSLLRHPKVVSTIDEFTGGSFRPVLGDTLPEAKASRILLCSGKVYYDLIDAREKKDANDVAIMRVEQMYPFPRKELTDALARHPATAQLVWVQEEPRNMGPWRFMSERMGEMLEGTKRTLRYVGRPESASPASGSLKRHQQEQADILDGAFAPEPVAPVKRGRLRRK